MITITAIYEKGVLRPTTPLGLPENSQVQIQVRQILSTEAIAAHRRRVHDALVATGLSLPYLKPLSATRMLTPEQRASLARKAAAGRPLSELILEERAGR